MKIYKTKIKDLKIIEPKIFKDNRGYFFESYNYDRYKKYIKEKFVQDDHSFSKKNVLRGIHFQYKKPQGQLFYLITGKIFLVAVDFRLNSKTFLKHKKFILKSDGHEQIYTPPGVGCGFYSLENNNHLVYKITKTYKPGNEIGVIWNDNILNIKWPCKKPIISDKDKCYSKIKNISFNKFKDLKNI